ncbi:MAG: hypothetical protein WBF67_05485, partial [Olleya sp.]
MCDHDLSRPTYSWKETAFLNTNTILTMKYNESVNDSLVDIYGRIKESYDFMEAETKTDSIVTKYKITE